MAGYRHQDRRRQSRLAENYGRLALAPPPRESEVGCLGRFAIHMAATSLPLGNVYLIAKVFGEGKIPLIAGFGAVAVWMTIVLPIYMSFAVRSDFGEISPREGIRSSLLIMSAIVSASMWLIAAIVAWASRLH